MNRHLELLAAMRRAGSTAPVPSQADLTHHLAERRNQVGAVAFAEFDYLAKIASEIWGASQTAHFARVLRAARATRKPERKDRWQRAEDAVLILPAQWQQAFAEQIEISRCGRRVLGRTLWSADHARNVIHALARWSSWCTETGAPLRPTGTSLDDYARHLTGGPSPRTTRTAADYIARINTGYALVEPGFSSAACDYVVLDWDERAKAEGATTKTGSQLIGADPVYHLGFEMIAEARSAKRRGVRAAKTYRNGLLLAIAISLPQRARALSCLAFDRTLHLVPEAGVHFHIPAQHLKLPEGRKSGDPLDLHISSQPLYAALQEYRSSFRPLFDDGSWLFPSMLSPGSSISEGQIGRLVGDMTEKAFGVRVSVHRLRDNVATTASEDLAGGGRAAAALLGHRDQAVTDRHYDHSTGVSAAAEFGACLDALRSAPVALAL